MKLSCKVIRADASEHIQGLDEWAGWQPAELSGREAARPGKKPSLPAAGSALSPAAAPATGGKVGNVGQWLASVAAAQPARLDTVIKTSRLTNGPSSVEVAARDWSPMELGPARSAGRWHASEEIRALQEPLLKESVERAEQVVERMRASAQAEIEAARLEGLQAARQEADEIIRQAQAAALETTRQAYQSGITAAQVEVSGRLVTAQTIVTGLLAWRDAMLAGSEPMVLDLIRDVAKLIFGEGVSLDRETLSRAFGRALADAHSLGKIRIRAHPEDVAALGPLWPEQQAALNGQSIELAPSQEIQRGGCLIEGQFGSVDARVERQMRFVLETLAGVVAANERAIDPFTLSDGAAEGEAQ